MVVLDAVGVVVVVGDEGRPLQAAGAGAAAEAVGVEALAHCLQHAVRDALAAAGAHRQGALGGVGFGDTHQPQDNRAIHKARAQLGLGDRAFSVAGPNLWNPLPPHIKSSTTLGIFKSNLKTYLLSLSSNNP